MPRWKDNLDPHVDIKVMLRNVHGKYLARDEHGLFFAEDRAKAAVFDFKGDRIQEQLENLERTQGITLQVDPVPPEEIYETCDRCKELFMPFMTFYDGKRFLCADCKSGRVHRPRGH